MSSPSPHQGGETRTTARDMIIQHPLDDRLPALLRSGEPLRGIFTALPSPAIVEMCAYAGFTFVIIDNEHGAAGFETTEHMLRAARASGIIPVVRCFPGDMARVLDMGASGVQVPMIETADAARDLVQRVRYPPSAGAAAPSAVARPAMAPFPALRTPRAATRAWR